MWRGASACVLERHVHGQSLTIPSLGPVDSKAPICSALQGLSAVFAGTPSAVVFLNHDVGKRA